MEGTGPKLAKPIEFTSFGDIIELMIYRPDGDSWNYIRVAWLLLMADALSRFSPEEAGHVRERAMRIVRKAIDDVAEDIT